ncbi:hypothetical protein EOD42_17615 [Rhodovarius crocodyli]|uniref:Nucleoside-diphosphate sugar epimerase n=1 Tax=Rhodovarius crocodyli TaxID=1979269 RepID=A0A437MCM9_9PROT|nr:ELM1/GtrOC1 family putative glycosyltransferase [Rhodovarius crocodyli]RVT95400.1 hypothetical protein EOD42_17615 [Rhodovarius crocodyli]
MPETKVWVLQDPRAGTAAQALGIAEALAEPFRAIPLGWSGLAALPLPWPSLWGLDAATRAQFAPPWPRLVISAGRRAAPAARWLRARGARTVHCMRPGPGAADFDLLVLPRHDDPAPAGNLLPILGATHRLTAGKLAEARGAFPALGALPGPRIALLLGALPAEAATRIGQQARALGGSVLATTSRRTSPEAASALAAALEGHPHSLFRWGDAGPNPFLGLLAHADAIIVSADSISMASEALVTGAAVFLADPGGLGPRHRAFADSLVTAGEARWLGPEAALFTRAGRNETTRVAEAIRERGLV